MQRLRHNLNIWAWWSSATCTRKFSNEDRSVYCSNNFNFPRREKGFSVECRCANKYKACCRIPTYNYWVCPPWSVWVFMRESLAKARKKRYECCKSSDSRFESRRTPTICSKSFSARYLIQKVKMLIHRVFDRACTCAYKYTRNYGYALVYRILTHLFEGRLASVAMILDSQKMSRLPPTTLVAPAKLRVDTSGRVFSAIEGRIHFVN